MKRTPGIIARTISFAGVTSFSGIAAAQAEGFAVNRFEPAERGSEWFVTDTLDFRPDGLAALGVVVDWAHRPLVFQTDDGTEGALIENQVYAHLGASFVFWHRLRLAASLPVVMQQTGETVVLDGETYLAPQRTAVGDLRLAADVRILGEHRDAFSLAAGLRAWMPTGDQAAYAGDDALRLGGHVLGAGELGMFAYAARLGVNYRGLESDFGDSSLGTEFVFAASAGVRVLNDALLLGPELTGSTVLADGQAFSADATPIELLFGGHYLLDKWRFGLGVGPGLSRGFGAPALRTLISAEYVLGAPETPRPTPTPVAAREESQPTPADCPAPADGDGDGVPDAVDACPTEAGPSSSDSARNGCPAPVAAPADTDTDGIPDSEDACPTEAGTASNTPSENGCPRVKVVGTKLELEHTVEFEVGSPELTAGGKELLGDVARAIQSLPSSARILVSGHTDNKGWPLKNQRLSEERAESVVRWLETEGGIAKGRLSAAGFGDTRPIATNDTDDGRKKNRRVDFDIESDSATSAAKDGE